MALMFDGAVNTNNFPLYESLLRLPIVNKTSTACPLRGTFFVKESISLIPISAGNFLLLLLIWTAQSPTFPQAPREG
jgi:hypothetical protein